jgi:hypothetical protein
MDFASAYTKLYSPEPTFWQKHQNKILFGLGGLTLGALAGAGGTHVYHVGTARRRRNTKKRGGKRYGRR